MSQTRLPDGEPRRLAALRALELLDTQPEERYDRITRLAQVVLDMPIALITLLDSERQWFKSRRGMDATEIPRELSFCRYAVEFDQVVVVPDLASDARFSTSPLVTAGPEVRFYASVPLHAPGGEPVGTVCVLDHRPRDFGPEQQEVLRLLAGITEREFQSRELADTLALVSATSVRASAVADSIIEGLITLGDDGLVTSANHAAAEMFGYPVGGFIGLTAFTLLADPDRQAYEGYLARYQRGEGSQVLGTRRQVTGIRSDGSSFDMELVVTITDTGHRHEFVALCRDVSERVRMERELRATQEHLKLLSDAALEGLAVREHGAIVEANHAFTKIFGYSPDEVLGMTPADFLAPETRDTLHSYFAERDGELIEATGLRKDGSRFPIEFAARDLSAGGFDRRVVAIRDITARREAELRAEEELIRTRRAQRTIQAIVDATREAMLFLGADGRIAFVNQGLFNLFTRGQAIDLNGRRVHEFARDIVGAFGESGNTLMDAVQDGLHEPDAEIVLILEQQIPGRRDLQLVIRPVFDPGGGYIGRLFVFRDITAEREMDRMKTEFVSVVAHELRTPLTSIKGYVELLLDGRAAKGEPKRRQMLGVIQRNADRLAALVSDLLDVSQLEAGGLELQRAPERVERLIADAVAITRPQFDEKKQSLDVEIEDGLPRLEVDGPRLVQVMTNLLSNANKYTPAEGHVAVRAACAGGVVELTVEDDGVGLSPEELEQLFTKFYRARNRATREAGGTGLGLVITRSLVQLHGGTIDVRSTPDHGSAFVVRLPMNGAGPTTDRGRPPI